MREEEIRDALRCIVDNRDKKALNYAVNYAYYALEMLNKGCAADNYGFRVQLIYVKNNITHWRGEDAKRVREILKRAIGNL